MTIIFAGAIFTPWAVVVGAVLALPALLLWGWPRARTQRRISHHRLRGETGNEAAEETP